MMTGTVALSRMLWIERVTAAWDQAVDGVELHQLDRRFVANVLDEHHAIAREPGLRRRVSQHFDDRDVRPQGAGRAAEERGVARLQADAGGVARDVRPVLVDDRDDAERHTDPLDLEAVRPLPAVEHLAHGVGQPSDVAEPFGHSLEAGVGEAQAVERPRFHPGLGGLVEIDRIGGEDLTGAVEEQVGGRVEGGVLLGGGRASQPGCRDLRSPPQF